MRYGIVPAVLACALLLAPGDAVARDDTRTARVAFLVPEESWARAIAEELRFGAQVAADTVLPGQPAKATQVILEDHVLPAPDELPALLKELRKDGVALIAGYLRHGRTADVEKAAAKAGLPLLVLSPEPTTPDLDGKRAVFWAGGVRPHDAALQAMDYLVQPLGSKRPAILHDGSAPARTAAGACSFFRHVSQEPLDARVLEGGFGEAELASLVKAGADGFVYFGGPVGAQRLLELHAAAKLETPVLLGQGLASAGVPLFRAGHAPTAWAMEARFFEDRGRSGRDERYPLEDAATADERRVTAATERGHRAMLWLRQALRAAGSTAQKKLVPALRALAREGAAGKPVFEPWGHASLARLELWKSAPSKVEKLPACHRRPELRVPIQGVPHVGCFSAKRFKWEPGTHYVWVRFTEGAKRTIEKDLQAIALHTGGYETDLEQRVLDDLLGRVLSKANRLFLRNPDGTSIPGVSYRISFCSEPPGKEVRETRKWHVLIGGDDPVAGGRAGGITAWVFSTFIQRTMYVQHKLEPPISASDRPHMAGTYEWDSSADENVRNGMVRSLVDGFSQALALTTAHELGHLAGCGHDTEIPRSIMNVQEGAGLEFDWAEWTESHARILGKRLKRAPQPK